MHTITVSSSPIAHLGQLLDVPQLPRHGFPGLVDYCGESPRALRTFARIDGRELPALIFVLPAMTPETLAWLARQKPDAYNEDSADLRSRDSYLYWGDESLEVRADLWALSSFPDSFEAGGFLVAFLSGSSAEVAVHSMDEDAFMDMVSNLQCLTSASGINYKPWRIYSEAEMEAVEGSQCASAPSVITAGVMHIRATDGLIR